MEERDLRAILDKVIADNPDATKAELLELFKEEIKDNPDALEVMFNYWLDRDGGATIQ